MDGYQQAVSSSDVIFFLLLQMMCDALAEPATVIAIESVWADTYCDQQNFSGNGNILKKKSC